MLFVSCSGPFRLRHPQDPGKSKQFKLLRFPSQPSGLESTCGRSSDEDDEEEEEEEELR